MTRHDSNFDADALTRGLLPAALEAGRVEMAHFAAGVAIERKADKSPVTVADREAEAIIVEALHRLAPDIQVIAEEAVSRGEATTHAARYFLVDALDGTRLFVKGSPEFSINVALIENGRAVYGLIYGPATGGLYLTRSDGSAAGAVLPPHEARGVDDIAFERLVSRDPDPARLVAYNSQSAGGRTTALLAELGVMEKRPFGSSLKFCLIAAGEGDIYARLGDTNEWDTAAGQAILEAAGGAVTTLDGQPLTYGDPARMYLNPHFIAWAKRPLKTWAEPPPPLQSSA